MAEGTQVQVGAKSNTKIKGDRGEALVRLMFEWHGCRVVEFGVENHLPEVQHGTLSNKAKATSMLRCLPDFVVVRETDSDLHPTLVEVKASRQAPTLEQVEKYTAYGMVVIVWVGPTGLKYSWVGGEKEFGFEPIEKLTTLRADPVMMTHFHSLASALHRDLDGK